MSNDVFETDRRHRSGRGSELPAWKVTLRRWVPFVDPGTYVIAVAVLVAQWAGPSLVARLAGYVWRSLAGAL